MFLVGKPFWSRFMSNVLAVVCVQNKDKLIYAQWGYLSVRDSVKPP